MFFLFLILCRRHAPVKCLRLTLLSLTLYQTIDPWEDTCPLKGRGKPWTVLEATGVEVDVQVRFV